MKAQIRISDPIISIDEIRAISGLSPARSIAAVLFEWLVIVVAIALSSFYSHPLVYLLAWIVIGSRMYGLYSLLHDGMHYLLHTNRQVNDWICKLFLAWPLFLSLEKVRNAHMAHHKYLKTDADPEAIHLEYEEFQFPKSRGAIALIFLKDLLGINFVYYKLKKLTGILKNEEQGKFDAGAALYYLTVFAVIIYMAWEVKFLVYWLIPYATVYQALNRLRLSTEHFHIPEEKQFQTRTVRLSFFERFIFSPHNLGFHAEHHLYPGVPFYRLKRLHKMLSGTPEFQKNVMVETSYVSVIKNYLK